METILCSLNCASASSFNKPSLGRVSRLNSSSFFAPLSIPLQRKSNLQWHNDKKNALQIARASMDLNDFGLMINEASTHAQGLMYLLGDVAADAAQSADSAVTASGAASTFVKTNDWLSGLSDVLENTLKLLEGGLANIHVPYAYGFSIILLTILVKAVTFPLTKKQVESTIAMQGLAPKIKAIQNRYAGDQERIQMETARLYKQAGVNPLAGCLPTLATLPVWIGLYRALSNAANEGILTGGFFWIPSLAGPTSLGGGLGWLFPFQDGAPPLGWYDSVAYLVLPVLLVASQYVSMQLMQPPQSNDPAQQNTQAILKFLPLMIGYFSLSVPSGLSLYWFTNNILSTAQQLYLKKGGGASTPNVEIIEAGQAKRTIATIATEEEKEKERVRGEKFRQLKEAEAARKAAQKKAAEEAAARASQVATASSSNSNTQLANDEDEDEDYEDESHVSASDATTLPKSLNGASKPTTKRSKRSKRSKKVA